MTRANLLYRNLNPHFGHFRYPIAATDSRQGRIFTPAETVDQFDVEDDALMTKLSHAKTPIDPEGNTIP